MHRGLTHTHTHAQSVVSFSHHGIHMLCVSACPCRCENATERMLEYAATLEPKCKPTAVVKKGVAAGAGAGGGKKEESWRDLPVEKRLEYALVKVSCC